jgi:hypothetical protein
MKRGIYGEEGCGLENDCYYNCYYNKNETPISIEV